MPGSMSQRDLVADLKRSLHDAAELFNAAGDGDFERMLATAAVAMQDKRPRTQLGQVTIAADEPRVPLALADFHRYKTHVWGSRAPAPWDPSYPGALPRISAVNEGATWALVFDPPPTARHIATYGSTCRFWYFATHSIGAEAADTTLAPADRPLLLLRAQAEAMRELTMRHVHKPVSLRDGYSGAPRNSTPAALYEALMAEWKAAQ
jgi:hypothetical protein